jgi:hypothetical protein
MVKSPFGDANGFGHSHPTPGLTPNMALQLGLKVDAEVLPAALVDQIKAKQLNLDDPVNTLALLRLNAVAVVHDVYSDPPVCKFYTPCVISSISGGFRKQSSFVSAARLANRLGR